MRKIKFRCWDIEYKKMITHGLISMDGVYSGEGVRIGQSFLMQQTDIVSHYRVDGELKSGEKIFEGDIVKTNKYSGTPGKFNDVIGVVKFIGYKFVVEIEPGFNCELHGLSEIIGNKYENPELLK